MAAITIPQTPEIAGTLINSIRDKIPDPVYSGSTPQPDSDGSAFRAQTLYRWISRGLATVASKLNWTVEDWWAMPLVAGQRLYTLDARWHQVREVFVNGYRCLFLDEAATLAPTVSQGQALSYGWHRRVGALDIALHLTPEDADPATTLSAAITTAAQDTISVTSSTDFLDYGWLRCENELFQYEVLGTNQVSSCRRGRAGTTATTHSNGTAITHCGLWVHGIRTPNPVTAAADVLELPIVALDAVEYYVLAQVRETEQSRQEARAFLQECEQVCDRLRASPQWQTITHGQIPLYGWSSGGVRVFQYDGIDGVIRP